MVQVLRLHVAPGKLEAYGSLFRNEVLPALRKVNSRVTVASSRLGTDGYDLAVKGA
jgi:hypothetical protein